MPTPDDMRAAVHALLDAEHTEIRKVGFGHLPDGGIDVQVILEVTPEAADEYTGSLVGTILANS